MDANFKRIEYDLFLYSWNFGRCFEQHVFCKLCYAISTDVVHFGYGGFDLPSGHVTVVMSISMSSFNLQDDSEF